MSIELRFDPDTQHFVIVQYSELLDTVPPSVARKAIKAGLDVIDNTIKAASNTDTHAAPA